MKALLARRAWIVGLVLIAAMSAAACGESGDGASTGAAPQGAEAADEAPARSAATGMEQLTNLVLTEADAGPEVIRAEYHSYDIGLPDKKGTEIHLTGDDASTLRWRMAEKPDPQIMEWYAVDGQLAFETDGLVGDPTTAAKVLEFRGTRLGQTRVVLELVERDPAARTGEPAKRLEYTFDIPLPKFRAGVDVPGMTP